MKPWVIQSFLTFDSMDRTQSAAIHWKAVEQGPVVRSMVNANHWLSSIKISRLPWYLTRVSADQASSNSALDFTVVPFASNFTQFVILIIVIIIIYDFVFSKKIVTVWSERVNSV